MKKVGLFFGSFNPIHIGHLILANYFLNETPIEELWFVITPQSPFKKNSNLLEDHHRYQLVYEAVKSYPNIKISKVEFDLPKPNYTVNTLAVLEEQFKGKYEFSLIMGADNIVHINKWKNADYLLEHYDIYVYPRAEATEIPKQLTDVKTIHFVQAPIVELSSSAIRKAIAENKEVRPLLPQGVWKYIDEMNFYK